MMIQMSITPVFLKKFVLIFVLALCIWSIRLTFRNITQCNPVTQLNGGWDSAKESQLEKPIFNQKAVHFDKIVHIAQGLIETATSNLPSRKNEPFKLSEWTNRTDGGLMDQDRVKLAAIYGAADSVFEYGLGESTYIASKVGVRRYAGIDSDATWVHMVRDKSPEHFRFYFADIGITVAWGHPKDNVVLPKSVFQYQLMPLLAEPHAFDVYMVDGRWRVPCMIASFLHASAHGAEPLSTTVLLHDCFFEEHWHGGVSFPASLVRTSYRTADHLLELVDHSKNRLCIYKRRPSTTDAQLLEFWEDNFREIE